MSHAVFIFFPRQVGSGRCHVRDDGGQTALLQQASSNRVPQLTCIWSKWVGEPDFILVVPGNIGKTGVVEHRRQRKHEVQLAKGSGIPV